MAQRSAFGYSFSGGMTPIWVSRALSCKRKGVQPYTATHPPLHPNSDISWQGSNWRQSEGKVVTTNEGEKSRKGQETDSVRHISLSLISAFSTQGQPDGKGKVLPNTNLPSVIFTITVSILWILKAILTWKNVERWVLY